MSDKYYCQNCKKIFFLLDTNRVKISDEVYTRFCKNCNTKLTPVCNSCDEDGLMKAEDNPPTGDYNEDGVPEAFCSECSYGWTKYMPGQFITFSKNKVKRTVHLIYARNHWKFSEKNALLKELFEKCHTYESTIKFLKEKTGESLSFLTEHLF